MKYDNSGFKENKKSHWPQVYATKLFGYYSGNMKMRNVNCC